jgi:hypothetical protein
MMNNSNDTAAIHDPIADHAAATRSGHVTILGRVHAPSPLQARTVEIEKLKLEAQRQHDAAAEAADSARAQRAEVAREHALTGRQARALDKADADFSAASAALQRAAERMALLDAELASIAAQERDEAEAARRRLVAQAARQRDQAAASVDAALSTLRHRVEALLEQSDDLVKVAQHLGRHVYEARFALWRAVRGELYASGIAGERGHGAIGDASDHAVRNGRSLVEMMGDADSMMELDLIERRREAALVEGRQ